MLFHTYLFGSIYNLKDNTILTPSLNPSLEGREDKLLPRVEDPPQAWTGEAGWG